MKTRIYMWTFGPAIFAGLFFMAASFLMPKGLGIDLALVIEQMLLWYVLIAAVVLARRFSEAGWDAKFGFAWLWLAGPLWLAVLTPIGLAIPNIVADPTSAALWIGASLFVGLNEETIFRGFMLSGLQRWMGPLSAAILSSLAFGGLHILNGLSGADPTFLLAQMVAAFGTGLILAAVTLRTGSIWPAVFLHFAADAVGLSALGGFGAAIQTSEAAPSMIIFGLIAGVWGAFWIWLLDRRGRLADSLNDRVGS